MTSITEESYQAVAASLAGRPVPDRPGVGPEQVVIVLQSDPAEFDSLMRSWPDHEFAVDLLGRLHELDVERASRPPVIQMTVTASEENGLVPGEYEVRTGPQPVVTFTPVIAPARADMTLTDMTPIPAADEPGEHRGFLSGFLARHGLGR